MPRIKLKSPKNPLANRPPPAAYDRRASDLGRGAMVAPVEIADPSPFDPNNPDRPATIIAFRSIRDNPLHRLMVPKGPHAKPSIDQAQYDAGIIWQNAYEKGEIGGARAIDTTREAVDGGRVVDPFNDAKSKAYDILWQARRGLIKELGVEDGRYAEALIRDVLGERLFLNQAAMRRGLSTDWQVRLLAEKFKNYLNILAVVYGTASKGSKPQNIVDDTNIE